jgi:hypothetical protein
VNAPAGFSPQSFAYLHQCAVATVATLNVFLRKWQPQALAGIGKCWNAGRPMLNPVAGVARYVAALAGNYAAVPSWPV